MKIDILDHGYIELIEHWGSDERIIEAARMSTSKGFLGWGPEVEYKCTNCNYTQNDNEPIDKHLRCPTQLCDRELVYRLVHHGDEKLLSYLYKNKHMTPFEMAGIIIEVQAPIFVFREWHRHRTQSYNELSARYTELPNLFYTPSLERMLKSGQSKINKQSSDVALTQDHAIMCQGSMISLYEHARELYEGMLKDGVAKEIARLVIPVAQYSRMRANANLRNWLQFLTLRMAPNAQWEIRQYANVVHEILTEKFPRAMQLFDEGEEEK